MIRNEPSRAVIETIPVSLLLPICHFVNNQRAQDNHYDEEGNVLALAEAENEDEKEKEKDGGYYHCSGR